MTTPNAVAEAIKFFELDDLSCVDCETIDRCHAVALEALKIVAAINQLVIKVPRGVSKCTPSSLSLVACSS